MWLQTALAGVMDITPRSKPLERGVVLHRRLQTDWLQQYYLYIPQRAGNHAKIFITVHGISRNVSEHARKFAEYAEKFGVVLIAPHFPSDRFPDYQRLGRKGIRADKVLNEIVSEVARLTGANANKLYLFGYSGGAQFAHRYMLAYPHRVAKIVLGAPGWYTFPNPTLAYPIGIQSSQNLPQVQFNPAQFLHIPACVLVGEKDNLRDQELNQSTRIDKLQGKTRIERGRRWVQEMTNQARARGLSTSYVFHLLPDSPHSFSISMQRGGMGEKTFDFLFSEG